MKSIKEILEPFILEKDGAKINHLYSHNAEYLIKQLEENQREFGGKLLEKAADNVNVDIDEFGNITGYDDKMKKSILNTLDDYLLNNKL